ncbi:hypothetical protein M0802_000977 [Mischocyttarus mexicanus]|nr:hypothetical protein M0802_000977 [Mischocyttarus mexicanus]
MSLTVDRSLEDETNLQFEDFIGTEESKKSTISVYKDTYILFGLQNLVSSLRSIWWEICTIWRQDRKMPCELR